MRALPTRCLTSQFSVREHISLSPRRDLPVENSRCFFSLNKTKNYYLFIQNKTADILSIFVEQYYTIFTEAMATTTFNINNKS